MSLGTGLQQTWNQMRRVVSHEVTISFQAVFSNVWSLLFRLPKKSLKPKFGVVLLGPNSWGIWGPNLNKWSIQSTHKKEMAPLKRTEPHPGPEQTFQDR